MYRKIKGSTFVVTCLVILLGLFVSCESDDNAFEELEKLRKQEVALRTEYIDSNHKGAKPVYGGVYVLPDPNQPQEDVKEAIQHGDVVSVYYEGYLLEKGADGVKLKEKRFDGNFDYDTGSGKVTPFSLDVVDLEKYPNAASRVISGWQIALCHMHVGERAEVVIPSHHGYGSYPSPIGSFQTLVFFLEVESKD
ncbi:FKBP-type peptidyl-prolyl cis-trans isomerase [Halosquirtibacter xylanolyticus]|uniref:FKBP-type peptidyl-prolyl cis-trans isomerase n=1 Tax=Halosquirtibacter xylanolyticus TaxID=3374599 RepID=UPI0037482A4C|nr:FKBP-type peptidyl-prolyl cis-trans isomerase [Prolixibacteraceae bacterium]